MFGITVYPTFTEKDFIPYVENIKLKIKRNFLLDSPERINPGDKTNNIQTITKIISGDTDNT